MCAAELGLAAWYDLVTCDACKNACFHFCTQLHDESCLMGDLQVSCVPISACNGSSDSCCAAQQHNAHVLSLVCVAHLSGSKDDEVRNLEAVLQHMQHQHDLACTDRQLLLERLVQTGGIDSSEEMAALAAAMDAEGYEDQEDDAMTCHFGDLALQDYGQSGAAADLDAGPGPV
jgi:hypothetical protein